MSTNTTIDKKEITKFESMASEWQNPNGKFKPLHKLNPCRLKYIVDQISYEFNIDMKSNYPFKNLRILDIGCGGGLLSEPMARLGAKVVGADAVEKNIPVARIHAEQSGLDIDYRFTTIEELSTLNEKFDVILNMEVIEHVQNPDLFLKHCHDLLVSDGLMICSTLNRNLKSFLFAIIGAEYILKWLPKGTHEWKKFITPDELFKMLNNSDLTPIDKKGFVLDKIKWEWKICSNDLSVNYVTSSKKFNNII